MSHATNCILTINDDDNFGNRLQNYAMQELMRTYGPVTTVLIGSTAMRQRVRRAKQLCKDLLRIPADRGMGVARLKRHWHFFRFTASYVPNTVVSMADDGTVRSRKDIRKVCMGSDQVWNYSFPWLAPTLPERMGSSFQSRQLLSYAASLGVSSVDDEYVPVFKRNLARIPFISVREIAARDALQPLTDTPIEVVLDPTLMLDAAHWRKVAAARPADERPYVLTYFLGKPSREQEEEIQAYAQEHHCTVKRLNDPDDVETYAAGPREFVSLFSKASYVFTDSYHACCFSVIFGRNFKVYGRNTSGMRNMNSRMETLFTLLELDKAALDRGATYPQYDYAAVHSTLARRQHASRDWLDAAMRG